MFVLFGSVMESFLIQSINFGKVHICREKCVHIVIIRSGMQVLRNCMSYKMGWIMSLIWYMSTAMSKTLWETFTNTVQVIQLTKS